MENPVLIFVKLGVSYKIAIMRAPLPTKGVFNDWQISLKDIL